MQKVFFFTLTLCVYMVIVRAGPFADVSAALSDNMNTDIASNIKASEHQNPSHEFVHVHHVPVSIPVYASMVVHDAHPQQQQQQQHHVSVGQYPFYGDERVEEAQSCAAPKGFGFRHFFHEAYDLLPEKKIVEIIKNANKYDPEVRAFRKAVFSRQTLKNLLTLRASNEFEDLSGYSCKRLFLNLRNFFKFISCLIVAEEPEVATESLHIVAFGEEYKGRPGLRGLIKDIYDILPREQLSQLYQRLKASDPYLAFGVEGLDAPEFRELLLKLRQVPEYKEIRKILTDAGLPIDEYNKLLAYSMGWVGDIPEEIFSI